VSASDDLDRAVCAWLESRFPDTRWRPVDPDDPPTGPVWHLVALDEAEALRREAEEVERDA
jgi:hypothetical protein